jgi:hypothetical protein
MAHKVSGVKIPPERTPKLVFMNALCAERRVSLHEADAGGL